MALILLRLRQKKDTLREPDLLLIDNLGLIFDLMERVLKGK